jgi:ankyrin repeat protein
MTGCAALKLAGDGKLARFEKWVARVAPAIPDCHGTPLIVALNEEGIEYSNVASGILLRFGVDVNVSNAQTKRTALHGATNWGDLDTIKTLLEHGANPNAQDDLGTTPLMSIAGTKGIPRDRDVVALLVKSGASLQSRDHRGNTAADYAMSTGNAQLHDYIVQLQSTHNP